MYVSLADLSPRHSADVAALVAYHVAGRGISLDARAIDADELTKMVAYYHAEGLTTTWIGGACAHLGLVEGTAVDPKQLSRLFQQRDPQNGGRLGRKGRVAAFDMTFGVEKDLSLIYALADADGQARIEAIMNEAVLAAFDYLQREAAVVRRGAGGLAHLQADGGLVGSLTRHVTARPVDGVAAPHVHYHLVIQNRVLGPDGKWTALDAHRLYELQRAASAIAGQVLHQRTAEEFGITWDGDEKGVFRIAGFDEMLRTQFSTRQQQLLQAAMDAGMDPDSKAVREAMRRVTREGKRDACGNRLDDLDASRARLAEEGVTYAEVMERLTAVTAERQLAREDAELIRARYGAQPEQRAARREWRRQVASELFGSPDATARLDAALAVDLRSDDERAYDTMMSVGRARSTWRRRDLLTALCDAGFAGPDALARIDAFVREHALAVAGVVDEPGHGVRVRSRDEAIFATRETLEREMAVVRAARAGLGQAASLATDDEFEQVVRGLLHHGIQVAPDSDQYEMLDALLRGRNAVQLVAGQAGSGKSTAIRALVDLHALHHPEGGVVAGAGDRPDLVSLIGLTTATKAADGLARESGISALNTTLFLKRLHDGKAELAPGAIVVVDEASMVSTSQLYEIEEAVSAAGGRLVLVGDPRQKQAVEAGGVYRTLAEELPECVVYLDEVRRQRDVNERAILAAIHGRGALSERSLQVLTKQGADPELLAALSAAPRAAAGDPASVGDWLTSRREVLETIEKWYSDHGRIQDYQTVDDAIAEIVRAYWDYAASNPFSTQAAMAESNAWTTALNRAMVDEALARGFLDPTKTAGLGNRTWYLGQRVIATKNDGRIGITNNELGVVRGVATRATECEITFRSPDGAEFTRTITGGAAGAAVVGASVPVWFSEDEIARRIDTAQARVDRLAELVGSQPARAAHLSGDLEKARATLVWSRGLTPGINNLIATQVKVLDEAPHLVVDIDPRPGDDRGRREYLPESYATKHLATGYCVNSYRNQGVTVDRAYSLDSLDYVTMSRARGETFAYLVAPSAISDEDVAAARRHLSPTFAHLQRVVGADRLDEAVRTATQKARDGLGGAPVALTASMGLTAEATPDDLLEHLAATAAADVSAGRAVRGVVQTRALARALNTELARQLAAASDATPFAVGDALFAVGQPVLATDDVPAVKGVEKGTRAVVAGVSRNVVFIDIDGGSRLRVPRGEFERAFVGATFLTAARAERETAPAERLLVVADGLTEDHLEGVLGTTTPTVVAYVDPELSRTRADEDAARTHRFGLLANAIADRSSEWSATRSLTVAQEVADSLRQAAVPTAGLPSWQAGYQFTATRLDEVREMTPRERARTILRAARIATTKRIVDFEERIADPALDAEDRAAAQAGLDAARDELRELDARDERLANQEVPDTDSEVAKDIAQADSFVATETERLSEYARRLRIFWQARVHDATMHPQPYHSEIQRARTGDPERDLRLYQEALAAVEEYRTTTGFASPHQAIGKAPVEPWKLDLWAAAYRSMTGLEPDLERTRTPEHGRTR